MNNNKLKSDSCSEKTFNFGLIYSKYGTVAILFIIFIISAIASPIFIRPTNLINVMNQVAVYSILACGQTMLIISGGIDLSQGSMIALSGCLGAGIMINTGSLTMALLVAVVVGLFFGWVNGFLITKFDLQPFIVTLASQLGIRGLAYLYTGGHILHGVGNLVFLGQGRLFGFFPMPVLIAVVILVITWVLLTYTKLGRYTYAIGGNSDAAKASGINVGRVKIILYTISSLFTSLAGLVLAGRINSGQPISGVGYEFDAIIGVILGGASFAGGIGNVLMTFIGIIIVGIINNIMNLVGISAYAQMVSRGVIIAIAVVIDAQTRKSTMSMGKVNK